MRYLLSILFLCLAIAAFAGSDVIPVGHFSESGLTGWTDKKFKGETEYLLVKDGGQNVLRAQSQGAASGLIFETDYDPRQYPVLSWDWKIDHVIENGDSRSKETDDYAARIYVIFPHWFFPMTKTLNYIWANRLPKEASQLSVYTSNGMMIAVESGSDKAGQWVTVRRNIFADYRKAFGEDPPMVGAIAIMTDTDNTGESALAWYGDITASRE
jgi:hypothetical protein